MQYGKYPGVAFCGGHTYGDGCPIQISSEFGDPCATIEADGSTHCLSQFYKSDWASSTNAGYFVKYGHFAVGIDVGNNCGHITLLGSASEGEYYGTKYIICKDPSCPCGSGDQPFRMQPY